MFPITNRHRAAWLLAVLALWAGILWPSLLAAADVKAPADASGERLSDRIDRLIAQLGSDEFVQRQRAQDELLRIGADAYDALQTATEHDDIEIAARAQYLVRAIRVDWTREGDSHVVKDLLKEYDRLSVQGREDRIEKLASLPQDEGLSALCRIARFEKAPLVAKQAAATVIAQKLPADADRQARSRTILDALGGSSTPAVEWLRAEARMHTDPPGAVEAWTRLIAAEEAVLSRTPQNSQHKFVVTLLRRQAELLLSLSRLDEAKTAMLRTLDFEQGSNDTLSELMDWLVERQAWDVVDQLAKRFADRLEQQPMLMYLMAQGRLKQGQPEEAAKIAEKALALNPAEQVKHYAVADDLQRRALSDWAEREYRATISIGPPNTLFTYAAQSSLSELLHDQDKHLAAAQVLDQALETLAKDAEFRALIEERSSVQALQSRRHYFEARHWAAQQDAARHIEFLNKAIAIDPTDADVLIALYRLPDQEKAQRQATLERIRAAANYYRNEIQQNPEDATPYNQFAWLIGNTEGDQAEALRYSQKSLELRPGAAGFIDTLARCYYASGDLESAIEHQKQAVEIDRGSGAMRRQLEFFQSEQAKKNRESATP